MALVAPSHFFKLIPRLPPDLSKRIAHLPLVEIMSSFSLALLCRRLIRQIKKN